MAKNAVLERQASSAMQAARAQSEATGETAHVYTAARYAARTWGHERRVVIKAEVVRLGERAPRDNPRVVVTNLRHVSSTSGFTVLAATSRTGELLDAADRPHELRRLGQPTARLAAAQPTCDAGAAIAGGAYACGPTWLRNRLLKLGVHVVRSRRVVLLRAAHRVAAIALALGARAG